MKKRGVLSIHSNQPTNIKVIEGEELSMYATSSKNNGNDKGLFFKWNVRNIENTIYVYLNAGVIIIVSSDLWRGMSVTFHNVGSINSSSSKEVDVWWNEASTENGRKNDDSVGGWLRSKFLRGSDDDSSSNDDDEESLEKIQMRRKLPIKQGTVKLGESFHVYLPDFKRSLIVVPLNEPMLKDEEDVNRQFENILVNQQLSRRCSSPPTYASFHQDLTSFKCNSNYQKIDQTDISGHDVGVGISTDTLLECNQHCITHHQRCGGIVYRSDLDTNCYMKNKHFNINEHRINIKAATLCVFKHL